MLFVLRYVVTMYMTIHYSGNFKKLRSEDIDHMSNSNSDVRFVKVGIDLYGSSIFHRVEHWRLFGFCVRDSVLWNDWCMHFVNRLQLVCVLENDFDSHCSRYDVVFVKPVRVVDDLCRSLDDFM